MFEHHQKKILPYSAQSMYELVSDIERYHEFLPWCLASRILKRHKNGIQEIVLADLLIGFELFQEKFTSQVYLTPYETIEVEYVKGPMSHMKNKWQFTSLTDDSCEVEFEVSFEFKSVLLQKMMSGFFDKAVAKMMQAFETRADTFSPIK